MCYICRGECSSTHADVLPYLRPEVWERMRERSHDRVEAAVKYAETRNVKAAPVVSAA